MTNCVALPAVTLSTIAPFELGKKRIIVIVNQQVETAVWVGKRFGKAFVEADANSFASRARSSLLQQMRHHVQAGHHGTSAG